MVADRYASWNTGLGAKVEAGDTTIQEMFDYAMANGEPKMLSAQQELYERVFNHGCDDRAG